jgi:hypothetical protein
LLPEGCSEVAASARPRFSCQYLVFSSQ